MRRPKIADLAVLVDEWLERAVREAWVYDNVETAYAYWFCAHDVAIEVDRDICSPGGRGAWDWEMWINAVRRAKESLKAWSPSLEGALMASPASAP